MENASSSSSSSSEDPKKDMKEPLLLSISNPKGGFRTLPFIIANEAFEKVASIGLLPNMILYLTREYGMEAATATNVLFMWSAATNFLPVLGAFLADSYLGRYQVISFGCIASVLGTFLLWLTAILPQARPPPCIQYSDNCKPTTTLQLLFLYFSFAVMSVGAGGIRSSSLAFGADQLKELGNLGKAGTLERYFSWYFVASSASAVLAITGVVYIQDAYGWNVGFGVPVALMILSALSFYLASPFYMKPKAKPSLLIGLAQVVAVSYNKRSISLSSDYSNEEYYCGMGKMPVAPSLKLRFFNKACIIRDPEKELTPDGRAVDPWSLCTVDQVEELKAIIKVMPIWLSGMMMSITISQTTFEVLQVSTMDRHITSNFEIPAGSFGIFLILSLASWVALYDRVFIPLASRIAGKPTRFSLMQKMGIGIFLSSASMAAVAIVESVRRGMANQLGLSDDPDSPVPMSAMWLLPHLIIGGLAEGFNSIAQNEFYYSELPKSMSSFASSLFGLGLSISSLLASGMVSAVNEFSKIGGNESWISSNINKGHYDYYFWLLAMLSLVNFVYYIACCKAYGPCKGNGGNVSDNGKGIKDEV